jgi:hypothetical protein
MVIAAVAVKWQREDDIGNEACRCPHWGALMLREKMKRLSES